LSEEVRGTRLELALLEALAMSSMSTRGNSNEMVRIAIERALTLASAIGDHLHQLRLLGYLQIFLTGVCEHHAALAIAERSATRAASGERRAT
jgi:hypothetical protein